MHSTSVGREKQRKGSPQKNLEKPPSSKGRNKVCHSKRKGIHLQIRIGWDPEKGSAGTPYMAEKEDHYAVTSQKRGRKKYKSFS